MAARRYKKPDLRELPAYSVAEASRYLNVPQATVRYWATGRDNYAPLISIPTGKPTLLSFINLAELHILAAIRRKYTVRMPKVRAAIDYLKKITIKPFDQKYPLISEQLETDGLDLFTERFGALLNISQDGQITVRELMSAALHRIERDVQGVPIKLFPFTRNDIVQAPEFIVIDPALSAGRPVIAGTGLATEIIAERYKAGESIEDLARDYERTNEEIQEAVRCELQAAA
ncbi:MAG: DUF433 domain-containing protein [Proteobacteria bacterium]|nr:DUF433 domain-containing protein [Pseudomonadota bacterium]